MSARTGRSPSVVTGSPLRPSTPEPARQRPRRRAVSTSEATQWTAASASVRPRSVPSSPGPAQGFREPRRHGPRVGHLGQAGRGHRRPLRGGGPGGRDPRHRHLQGPAGRNGQAQRELVEPRQQGLPRHRPGGHPAVPALPRPRTRPRDRPGHRPGRRHGVRLHCQASPRGSARRPDPGCRHPEHAVSRHRPDGLRPVGQRGPPRPCRAGRGPVWRGAQRGRASR
jgi:hypothetical protein